MSLSIPIPTENLAPDDLRRLEVVVRREYHRIRMEKDVRAAYRRLLPEHGSENALDVVHDELRGSFPELTVRRVRFIIRGG